MTIKPWYVFEDYGKDEPKDIGFRVTADGDFVRTTGFVDINFLSKQIATASKNILQYESHTVQKSLFQRIGRYGANPFDLHFVINSPEAFRTGDYVFETTLCPDYVQRLLLRDAFAIWANAIQDAHN